MSEIIAKVVRFNLAADGVQWLTLHDKLTRAGMTLYNTSDRYVVMPQAGPVYLSALEFYYLDDGLRIVRDFMAIRQGGAMVGYYLELPAGCQPATPDPDAPPAGCAAGESRYKQAVRWLCAEPGRTQTQAAELFNVKQGNISLTLRRMRSRGEI